MPFIVLFIELEYVHVEPHHHQVVDEEHLQQRHCEQLLSVENDASNMLLIGGGLTGRLQWYRLHVHCLLLVSYQALSYGSFHSLSSPPSFHLQPTGRTSTQTISPHCA